MVSESEYSESGYSDNEEADVKGSVPGSDPGEVASGDEGGNTSPVVAMEEATTQGDEGNEERKDEESTPHSTPSTSRAQDEDTAISSARSGKGDKGDGDGDDPEDNGLEGSARGSPSASPRPQGVQDDDTEPDTKAPPRQDNDTEVTTEATVAKEEGEGEKEKEKEGEREGNGSERGKVSQLRRATEAHENQTKNALLQLKEKLVARRARRAAKKKAMEDGELEQMIHFESELWWKTEKEVVEVDQEVKQMQLEIETLSRANAALKAENMTLQMTAELEPDFRVDFSKNLANLNLANLSGHEFRDKLKELLPRCQFEYENGQKLWARLKDTRRRREVRRAATLSELTTMSKKVALQRLSVINETAKADYARLTEKEIDLAQLEIEVREAIIDLEQYMTVPGYKSEKAQATVLEAESLKKDNARLVAAIQSGKDGVQDQKEQLIDEIGRLHMRLQQARAMHEREPDLLERVLQGTSEGGLFGESLATRIRRLQHQIETEKNKKEKLKRLLDLTRKSASKGATAADYIERINFAITEVSGLRSELEDQQGRANEEISALRRQINELQLNRPIGVSLHVTPDLQRIRQQVQQQEQLQSIFVPKSNSSAHLSPTSAHQPGRPHSAILTGRGGHTHSPSRHGYGHVHGPGSPTQHPALQRLSQQQQMMGHKRMEEFMRQHDASNQALQQQQQQQRQRQVPAQRRQQPRFQPQPIARHTDPVPGGKRQPVLTRSKQMTRKERASTIANLQRSTAPPGQHARTGARATRGNRGGGGYAKRFAQQQAQREKGARPGWAR